MIEEFEKKYSVTLFDKSIKQIILVWRNKNSSILINGLFNTIWSDTDGWIVNSCALDKECFNDMVRKDLKSAFKDYETFLLYYEATH